MYWFHDSVPTMQDVAKLSYKVVWEISWSWFFRFISVSELPCVCNKIASYYCDHLTGARCQEIAEVKSEDRTELTAVADYKTPMEEALCGMRGCTLHHNSSNRTQISFFETGLPAWESDQSFTCTTNTSVAARERLLHLQFVWWLAEDCRNLSIFLPCVMDWWCCITRSCVHNVHNFH